MITTNIKFNRVVAKENFNNNNIEELKNAIEKGILSETGLIVASDMKKAKEILNPMVVLIYRRPLQEKLLPS